MILTVTLNFALDITYELDRVEWGRTNAVRPVGRRAGGKGVNVARTLHQLGHAVTVTGLAGGTTGAVAREELTTSGMTDAMVEVSGESRSTLVVVEAGGEVTGFSEPGPEVSGLEWDGFADDFPDLVDGASVVVLSGSVPPGVPVDAYARLIGLAGAVGVPVVLDSHGDALVHGVAAGPAIVAINAEELSGVLGSDEVSVVAGAERLRRHGASAVVVSSGPDGIVCVTEEGSWRAAPPERLSGNPIGAGDAATAALAVGLVEGRSWPERLCDAVAVSAAAVCAPLAGSFDDSVYRRLLARLEAEEIGAS